jgi:uncharacterized protein YdhG (YjbR/CyaY superfamily)
VLGQAVLKVAGRLRPSSNLWAGPTANEHSLLILQGARAMAKKHQTIDDYLGALPDDQRAALEQLRKTIRAAAPKAEERISYQLPAFRLDGRMLVAFGATANHCAFYLMSSSTVEAYKEELEGYDTSKGTIRFQPGNPLPDGLVRELVKARIAENAAQRRAADKAARPR